MSPAQATDASLQGIVMVSFTATAQADGILVKWETASEVALLGFNVYRDDGTGQWVQLNDTMIPAESPGSPVGGLYQWHDELPPEEYTYWLDLVNTYGGSCYFGPVSTVFPEPEPVEASFTPPSSTVVSGDSVTFTNLSTGDGPLTYEWNFGDGSPLSNDEHPTHVYADAGAFTVVLTVTNPVEQAIATGSVDVNVALAIATAGNGVVEPSAGTHVYALDAVVPLEATADPGWEFAGWSGDLESQDNPLAITMAGNMNITATFEQVFALTITQEGTGDGTVEPDATEAHSYRNGAEAVLTATPAPGSVFAGWSGDIVTTTNPLIITMDGNKNVTAVFDKIVALTVTKSGAGAGTVEPSLGVHSGRAGRQMTLIAVPAPGSVFVGWSGDVIATTEQLTITIDKDLEAVAVFEKTTQEKTTFRVFLPIVQRNNGG